MRIEANRKRNASAASRLAPSLCGCQIRRCRLGNHSGIFFFAASFRRQRPLKLKSLSVLNSPAQKLSNNLTKSSRAFISDWRRVQLDVSAIFSKIHTSSETQKNRSVTISFKKLCAQPSNPRVEVMAPAAHPEIFARCRAHF